MTCRITSRTDMQPPQSLYPHPHCTRRSHYGTARCAIVMAMAYLTVTDDRVGTGEWSGRPLAIPPSSFIFLVISLKLSHPTAKDNKQSCSSVHVLFNPVNALMHAGCCMNLVDNKIWKIRFCAPDTPTIQTLFIYHCS